MDAIANGTILDHQWGYEQTNHDFYKVVRSKGEWVWIVPMTATESHDGPTSMTGRVVPAECKDATPARRKVQRWATGAVLGVRINAYTGCAQPWSGSPQRVSHYG